MARMKTGRLTSATTNPPRRSFTPAAELEAQDASFISSNKNYEAQMSTYKNAPKGAKSYASFGGGAVDVSKEGLAQYNKNRPSYEPEATRIERPRAGGSEADFLDRVTKKGGFVGHVTYKEPTKPTNKKADWSNVQLDKMPTNKAKVQTPKGKLRQAAEADALPTFTDPAKVRTKTSAAMTGGKNGLTRATSPGAGLGAAKVTTETKSKAPTREGKLFKAYARTTATGDTHIGKSSADIKSYKEDYKSQRQAYRKEGNVEGVKLTSMEINQARKAERFAARGEAGRNKQYTDSNYRKTTGNTGRIANDFRKSAENAANRNTMQNKLKAVSGKSSNKTNLY